MASKAAPTLADSLIKEWQRPPYRVIDRNNWLASHIVQARKFVLDESMSAFMADLSYASLLTCDNEKKSHQVIDGMRKLARLPHALTWIEYDMAAKHRRAHAEYNKNIDLDPEAAPDRCGWLLLQHPSIETAFMAIHCISHSWTDPQTRTAKPNTSFFAYGWTSDDGVPPWPRDAIYNKDQPTRDGEFVTPAGILSGVFSYRTDSMAVVEAPHISREAAAIYSKHEKENFHPLAEVAGDIRYLWSLLATINDLPTSLVDVKQDRGYVSRGRYRKFSDHTVISLTVPEKRYQTVAKRAIAIARRRGHQVRGHFRKDRFHPGERIWVREHVRGDTSIGFVLHDYAVKHDTTT